MSDASDDPVLLFTPAKSTTGLRDTDINGETPLGITTNNPDASTRRKDVKGTRIIVDIRKRSTEELAKYQPSGIPDDDSEYESEGTSKIEEIVGEHRLGDRLYLFARYSDGIVRRKEDWEFRASFPGLYEDYAKRKKEGLVPVFDPSSTRIHPKHRVHLVINFPKRKPAISKSEEYASVSESSGETAEASDDEDEDAYVLRGTRASRRQANKRVRALPFSPKRTRTRNGGRMNPMSVDNSESDQEDEGEDEDERPTRRSTRATKKGVYADNADSDFEDDLEESSDYHENRSGRNQKKNIKRRGPKPAYGRIRRVEDLYDSDPETAALRAHRDECEKCHRAPAHVLLKKRGKKKPRRRKRDDDSLSESDEDTFNKLGGWVRCLKCVVAAHWNCLAKTQRAEIVKAARAKAEADKDAPKITDLEVNETTEFICGSCSKGGICMMCHDTAVEPERKQDANDEPRKSMDREVSIVGSPPARELLFRCRTCKRLAHYSHLPAEDEDLTLAEVAHFYQKENKWQCGDCASYIFPLDKIIAWRLSPPNAVDSYMANPENANYKDHLPREYLVKWLGRSYRRLSWVPHMWLVATHWQKLKNFYELGPRLEILSGPVDEHSLSAKEDVNESSLFNTEDEPSRAASENIGAEAAGPPPPLQDADSRIPPLWKTIDRVLDVLIWSPRKMSGRSKKEGKLTKQRIEDEEDSEDEASPEARAEYDAALDSGEEPSRDVTETIDEFEKRTGQKLGEEHIGRVIWAFIKWSDLPYDESTWDSPPRKDSFGYPDFVRAFKYFLLSRKVIVKKKTASEITQSEDRRVWNSVKLGIPEDGKYDLGQEEHFKLMPFQVEGVNWLCRNWYLHQQSILADEMGLGKTVQIISFLGLIHAKLAAFPCLVVVPNSTITNWVREFARWAPALRVVPFYGEQKSREIIKKYELEHPVVALGTTGAKYHILVATYEAVTNAKDFNSVFRKNPRWEVLIVDEGQRLKSDSSLIFRRLKELNSIHRIIMTGTPLNNNIRELFNLMNFLDPDKWDDLEALTKEFEELDEERVKDLHGRLRPYFLRRVKAEVLDLPSKNEVIVPISMAPLQKQIYKSILSKNLSILRSLTGVATDRINKSVARASSLRNMLMQLRKCLQHPYLVADDIEPNGLSPTEAHLKLIDASGKLRFLKVLLPKLKARGHRVLLFSQFVIGLNIILYKSEDFLQGEGYKFLRLDGNTKQAQRQKDMDEFNRENSDVFIYILSTRAGGVGINLWSADTVIIFDPDFNPHQDLQAIARAHRYGQKKTCLVFKFMTKTSAEEKIFQTGKKKLVLDHLIVQKMDDEEDANEVQSILTFGAKALFSEETDSRDITYSENEVEALIEKVETEEEKKEATESTNNAFAFAKIWSAQNDALDDVPDEAKEDIQDDSWAQTLQKIAEVQNRSEAREEAGRGVRRKAAMVKRYYEDVSPDRPVQRGKKKQKSGDVGSSDDEYSLPQAREASTSPSTGSLEELDLKHGNVNGVGGFSPEARELMSKNHLPARHASLSKTNEDNLENCGLCFTRHGPGRCPMTKDPMHLVAYRKTLVYSFEENYKDRVKAVRAIDETLTKQDLLHLVANQPRKPKKKDDTYQSPTLDGEGNVTSSSSNPRSHSSMRPLPTAEGTGSTVRWWETKFGADAIRLNADKTRMSTTPISSLKRSPSPVLTPELYAKKKTKVRTCDICMKVPYHLPVNCPVVSEGPESVRRAIARLTKENGSTGTLTALRGILRTQRKSLEPRVQPSPI